MAKKNIAALFDLDGVIIDTETQYTELWSQIGQKFYPETADFAYKVKGQTLNVILKEYFPDPSIHEDLLQKLADFESSMTYEYIAGVIPFLQELKRNDIKIAVVTSSNQKKMNRVYAAHPEFTTYFDRILTAEMFTNSKPEPDCYLLGSEIFNTPVKQCFVFEDSINGLKAGKAAGMKVVGLSTTNPPELISHLSDIIIPDFEHYTIERMLDLLS